MKPIVALDMRMAWHSGIGTYVRHLAQELKKAKGSNSPLQYRFCGPKHLINAAINYIPQEQCIAWDAPIYGLAEQWRYLFLRQQWDVWHSPHYNAPLIKKGKLVVTVHDLIHLVFAGKYFSKMQETYARTLLAGVRKHADAVIAVSHHTKKDLIERAGFDPAQITVIHEAADESFCPQGEAAQKSLCEKYNLSRPYVLYVGNLKPHKNVSQLVRVFQKLKRQKKIEGILCLAGKMDTRLIQADKDLQSAMQDSDIRFLSDVSSKDLPALYSASSLFVLPSLYEGFGLTVLEAMACGTPVLLSDSSSLPEIAGEAARYFNPDDDSSLEHHLLACLSDQALRQDLSQKGLAHARRFSWQDMADATQRVYQEIG